MVISNLAFRRLAKMRELTDNPASIKGIIGKSGILLAITLVSALLSIYILKDFSFVLYLPLILVDLVFMLIMCFVPKACKVLSIPYAIAEGVMAGAIALLLEYAWPGYGLAIAGVSLIATIVIYLVATILYVTGVIKVTAKFRAVLFTMMISLFIIGILLFLAFLIFPVFMSAFYVLIEYSGLSILISIFYVILASLYCILSMDNAVQIAESGIDKDYEWYAAFGILINVIWLYYEVLRLVIRIVSRVRNN